MFLTKKLFYVTEYFLCFLLVKEVIEVILWHNAPASRKGHYTARAGAAPATSTEDILHALDWDHLQTPNTAAPRGQTPAEQTVFDLLFANVTDGAALLTKSELSIQSFNQTLTMLEITGKIRALGNNH